MTLPAEFDLAHVAHPGDVVILRMHTAGVTQERRGELALQLRRAAEYWGVRFVILDDQYFDIERPTPPEAA